MDYEGMVHALEEIRRVLKPQGVMVDIHPVPHELTLEAVRDGEVFYAEPKAMTYVEDVLQAEAALAEVVEGGLYRVAGRAEFDYLTYAGSAAELRQHWEEMGAYDDSPEDEAILAENEAQYQRFADVLSEAGDGVEIVSHEKARIARMEPVI